MRVAFTTLGCRLNLFETEAMRHRLRLAGGADTVGWNEAAEVYVINSCTVTARAEQKCRQLARAAKRRHPEAKVVVVGCYAQVNGQPLMELPEIDAALGNEEKKRFEEHLPAILKGQELLAAAPYTRGQRMNEEEWIEDFAGRSRAMIKVQEGCNMRCTFCAIWSARGPSRSREPREIVHQAQRLAEVGYEEIVLGGVHLGHYGRDLSPRVRLSELLQMLLELVDEGVRFRLSSIDPSEVDHDLVRLLVEEPRLCRYLHLPLQSGSDRVLKDMRRAYDRAKFCRLVDTIAAASPDFGLGVDVIVGFPSEDERAFSETLGLLESYPISFYHVFPYSDRPGTPASALEKRANRATVLRRSRRLRALGKQKRAAFLRAHVGGVYEGVVEGSGHGAAERGREIVLGDYSIVRAEAPAALERKRVEILVTAMDDSGRLQGRILGTADTSPSSSLPRALARGGRS